DLYIDAINHAVKNAPREVTIGMHVCRGNYKGMYLSEGGYDSVAEKFFARTNVNHFLLEFDTPRAGSFEPLRFVPKNKGVVLGLVSSKTPRLEDPDLLRKRVDEAAKHIDMSRLAIGPQCGFASTIGGNPVTDATVLAIKAQEQAGLDIITDGETRRESYSNRFATALEGVDIDNPGTALDRSGHPNPVPRVVGKVRRKHPVEVQDLLFLKKHT